MALPIQEQRADRTSVRSLISLRAVHEVANVLPHAGVKEMAASWMLVAVETDIDYVVVVQTKKLALFDLSVHFSDSHLPFHIGEVHSEVT